MYKIIGGDDDSNTGIIILISIIIIVIIIIVAVFLFHKNTDFAYTWYTEDNQKSISMLVITSSEISNVVNVSYNENHKNVDIDNNNTATINYDTMTIIFAKGKDGSQTIAKCTLISDNTMKMVATNSNTGTIISNWNKLTSSTF